MADPADIGRACDFYHAMPEYFCCALFDPLYASPHFIPPNAQVMWVAGRMRGTRSLALKTVRPRMFKSFSGHLPERLFPSRTNAVDALTAQLEAARAALVDALRACDHAVRRGDGATLDALQRDMAERQTALQTLSQRWLEQAAQQHRWTVTGWDPSADLIECDTQTQA